MKLKWMFPFLYFIFALFYVSGASQGDEPIGSNANSLRLKQKIIPLSNSVYQAIEYFESKGCVGFIPLAKPYTKGYIIDLLNKLEESGKLSKSEKSIVNRYLSDLGQDNNGLTLTKNTGKNTFALIGFNAETNYHAAAGDNGTWSTNLIGEPYLTGDMGDHWTFTGGIGLSIERLSPDMFYQSYTRNHQVNFPFEKNGYSYLPYQFGFDTMWAHFLTTGKDRVVGFPIKDGLTAGMIYHTEVNGSWYNNALQLSLNNQQRAWGVDQENLVLSSTARRFPGLELKIHPIKWLNYSFLTGSLFSYPSQTRDYKKDIYGYDVGQVQKNFTYHLIEFIPAKWLQLSFGGGNIWSKRVELAYILPLVFPHFTQTDLGDHDNTSMNIEIASQIPKVGMIWTSFFIDEFNFTGSGPLLRMPDNRYAWQIGWKTALLSRILPGTTSVIKYTRVSPFTYSHYTDTLFNTFGNRPNDMTYSHDGFNLGFYLPPNSSELNWKIINIAIPDLILQLNNRFIIHGTNDLSSPNNFQIYGDINRYLVGTNNFKYPLSNFTKDGIYDWTVLSEFKFDWKIRKVGLLNYLRLQGSIGYSKTWWKSNQSQVIAPSNKNLMTGSLGIVVEI